jgi:TatD DNase family protein
VIELFDTHAHFEGERSAVDALVGRAREAGVTRILAVGGNEELNAATAGFAYRALGWDRDQIGKDLPELDYGGVCAVGEIGLDYHYDPESKGPQRELLARQLQLGHDLGLPVVIHTREADDDTLGLLREIPSKGIVHCFTGNPAFCRRLLDLGFSISISGIVTFRAADNVRESARIVPDDRILIETDAPFLAPVPMRGKANEPAFLVHTAMFLSELRKTPLVRFAALTVGNALGILDRKSI